ncbi:hypothetical protein EVAR_19084_1 [Eumeta japonica]|uniref:Uncharacterized protein n=1 Tax=Eumeta variegata TaxID=151549 RepID=A0A4C1UQH3_EUMVA|nr:hypothetical protein EVAR_19084_1 [Eumeta japonica]
MRKLQISTCKFGQHYGMHYNPPVASGGLCNIDRDRSCALLACIERNRNFVIDFVAVCPAGRGQRRDGFIDTALTERDAVASRCNKTGASPIALSLFRF